MPDEWDKYSRGPMGGGDEWDRYARPAAAGTVPEKPLRESGVTIGERITLQNVAPSPQAKIDWLKKRGYEAMFTSPSGDEIAVRKAGTGPWRVIDPRGADLGDILDIGDELAFGVASGAGAVQAGPLGAAAGGAATEGVRQALASAAGFEQTPQQVLEDVALSGAVGGATELVLRGAGGLARRAFGRGGAAAPEAPARTAVNLLEPKARITPSARLERSFEGLGPPAERTIPGVGRQAGRLGELREEGWSWRTRPVEGRPARTADQLTPADVEAGRRALEEAGGVPFRPSAPVKPKPDATSRVASRTPGIRHTLTREEGGAIRETTEQLTPRPEQVKPSISLPEAQKAGKGSFEEASRIIERAPKDAEIHVTFLKKGTKKTGPEVRTARVYPNAAGPRWLSEGEVRKQTSKMPIEMLRELAEEHGPAPGIVKKTYGTSSARDLDHEGLAKWLYEKQPGVVTERGGPSPKTRKAENIRHQLEQFWEEFGEHTPGESAAKQARSHLKNLIEGRKESGGYRRFKDIVEVKVGDDVYRFDGSGTPLTASAQAQKAIGRVGKKLVSAAGKLPSVRAVKGLLKVAEKFAPETTRKIKEGAKRFAKDVTEEIAEEVPEEAVGKLGRASESVKKHLRRLSETIRKRGRVAAQAEAYALIRQHPELAAWAEEETEG